MDVDTLKTEHACSNQEEQSQSVQRIIQNYHLIMEDCVCPFRESSTTLSSSSSHLDEQPNANELPEEKRRKVERMELR